MEIEKSVKIVYTKEALIDLVIANAAQEGYVIEPKAVKFLNKRNSKSDFKTIVVNELTEKEVETEKEEK